MPLELQPASNLRVEVSGWDETKEFFVENSGLLSTLAGERTVFLRHRLRVGSLVFVRLVAPSGFGKGQPIAHRTESIQPASEGGVSRVRLVESQPRRAAADVPFEPIKHLIECAGERGEVS